MHLPILLGIFICGFFFFTQLYFTTKCDSKKTENYYSFWLRAVDQADLCQLLSARYY